MNTYFSSRLLYSFFVILYTGLSYNERKLSQFKEVVWQSLYKYFSLADQVSIPSSLCTITQSIDLQVKHLVFFFFLHCVTSSISLPSFHFQQMSHSMMILFHTLVSKMPCILNREWAYSQSAVRLCACEEHTTYCSIISN